MVPVALELNELHMWPERRLEGGLVRVGLQSIILLFGQQTEPPHSLSRSRNSDVNRRKIEK